MTTFDTMPALPWIAECLDRLDALLKGPPPFFRPRRRAARDAEIRRLLERLREALSREAARAAGQQAEAETVLRRAQDEARRIVVEAEEHARRALGDGTLLRAAELQGRQLREQAIRDADEIRREADAYALHVLERLEREVAHALTTVRRGKTMLAERLGARGGDGPLGEHPSAPKGMTSGEERLPGDTSPARADEPATAAQAGDGSPARVRV